MARKPRASSRFWSRPKAALRGSLVRTLVALVVVFGSAMLAITMWGSNRTVAEVSTSLVQHVGAQSHAELGLFFDPVKRGLGVASELGHEGRLDLADVDTLNDQFMPLLERLPQVSSVLMSDREGRGYLLLRDADGWRNRLVDAERSPGQARWLSFDIDGAPIDERVEEFDYDPRSTPWYARSNDATDGEAVWTEAYRFATTQEPGITAVTTFTGPSGAPYVLAFDVKLIDLSSFTERMRVSEHGSIAIVDERDRLLGLPSMGGTESQTLRANRVLQTPDTLQLDTLMHALAESVRGAGRPFRMSLDSGAWWASVTQHNLDDGHAIRVAVMVPESDFLGDAIAQRNLVLGLTVLMSLLAAFAAFLLDGLLQSRVQAAIQHAQRLGPYTLDTKLGEGAMGAVYRAHHAMLRRPTAVKLLLPDLASSPSSIAHFEQEVQLTSQLTHPNTVAIYDFGRTRDGVFYYAMEYIEGLTLGRLIGTTGPLPPERAAHLLAQVAGSLAEAHDRGLVHRDIKPANLMVCVRGGRYDVVKVLDFGLVKELRPEAGGRIEQGLAGTPITMSPEAIHDPANVDGRSDLYSLGVTAFFLLTGVYPYEADTSEQLCAMHTGAPIPDVVEVRGAPLPAGFAQLVTQLLAKDRDDRPATAAQVEATLRGLASDWTDAMAQRWWAEFRPQDVPAEAAKASHDTFHMTLDVTR